MPAERPSRGRKPEALNGEKWIVHKQSRNKFRITKLHRLHAEILNEDGTPGYVNLDMLLHDIECGLYEFEAVKKGR